MIIYSDTSGKYPVYLHAAYFKDMRSLQNEVRLSIFDDNGYCDGILCRNCPLGPNCGTPSVIAERLIPDFHTNYPELLI